MLILPVVLGALFLAFKLDQKMPGLYFMFVLQMSAPGLMSSPALAALLVPFWSSSLPRLHSCSHSPRSPYRDRVQTASAHLRDRPDRLEPCCALAAGVIRLIAGRRFIVNKPVYLRGCGVARLTASC
jgi:hypothetical protein